jgi:hypothetical protein
LDPMARTLIFGLFEADVGAGELRKAGTRIKLESGPQSQDHFLPAIS